MSGNRITIETPTPEHLARTLRQFAELTARHSNNWDNYEEIVRDVLKQIWEHYEQHPERNHGAAEVSSPKQ